MLGDHSACLLTGRGEAPAPKVPHTLGLGGPSGRGSRSRLSCKWWEEGVTWGAAPRRRVQAALGHGRWGLGAGGSGEGPLHQRRLSPREELGCGLSCVKASGRVARRGLPQRAWL